MDIKSKDLKYLVYKGLESTFINDGFTYKKTNNEFHKVINDFTYVFNIEQTAWSSSFSFHVNLLISQKTIENILERIIGKQQYNFTMDQTLDRIASSTDGRQVFNKNMSIWIYNRSEIDFAINTLISYYENIAKKYFTLFCDLKTIDDFFNKPPFDYPPAFIGGGHGDRCMKGLIVAKLVNNFSLKKLIKIYDKEILRTENIEIINNYEKVKDSILGDFF